LAGREPQYLSNKQSYVHLDSGHSFRNPPHFLPLLGEVWENGREGWSTDLWEPQVHDEVAAFVDHLVTHPSTGPFLAFRFIQRLITSNPSPRYMETVVDAFNTGTYAGKTYSGKYGDLGAMVAAIYLDPEAADHNMDSDPTFGTLREPILKLMHVFRALEYRSSDTAQREVMLYELQDSIRQEVFNAPDVFGFYPPLNVPAGPIGEANLYSPEAFLANAPVYMSFLNGLNGLVDTGLTNRDQGFGTESIVHGRLRWRDTTPARSGDAIVRDLDTLLTGGRLNDWERSILKDTWEQQCVYIGCYRDRSSNRDLPVQIGSGGGFTTETCAAGCKDYTYYALQDGGECRCGDSFGLHGEEPDEDCGIEEPWCGRGPCGASRRNAVYKHTCGPDTTRTRGFAENTVMKLMFASAAFNAQQTSVLSAATREPVTPTPSRDRPYKAIVVILLMGGIDSHNMLVPHSGCGDFGDLHEHYTVVRGPGAISQDALGAIGVSGQPCSTYGVHPRFRALRSIYRQGDAAFVANVGAMVEPITLEEYRAGSKRRPRGLFSHDTMQANMQHLHPQITEATGVLGRAVNALGTVRRPYKSNLYSITGNTRILAGSQAPFVVSARDGVRTLDQYSLLGEKVHNLTKFKSTSLFSEQHQAELDFSLVTTFELSAKMDNTPTLLSFSNTDFSLQMQRVAQLVKMRDDEERAVFAVSNGGWDTHSTHDLDERIQTLDRGIDEFVEEMKAQGMWDDVVVLAHSEFGRTLTSNGVGTDHGWAGNTFIMGGDIRGLQVHGNYPADLSDNNPLSVGRGRLIPDSSWMSIWKPLLEWFDVPSDQMSTVLPNLGNFPSSHFISQEAMFKSS